MIGNLDHLGPWERGEDSRYLACARHESAFSRLDFDDAWTRAAICGDCVAATRENGGEE